MRTAHEEFLRSLPVEWEQVPISALGQVVSGGTPSRIVPAFWNGDRCWVTPGELTALPDKWLHDTRERITDEGIRSSAATMLPVGSLLVTTRATIGAIAVAAVPVSTNQGFKSIVPSATAHSAYYYHLLRFITAEFKRLASGSTFDEISRSDFAAVLVPRPPIPEQKRIAEILDTADAAIEQSEAVITKLRLVKAGLMHDLLTRGLVGGEKITDIASILEDLRDGRLAPVTGMLSSILEKAGKGFGKNGDGHWSGLLLRNPVAHPDQFKETSLGLVPKCWDVEPVNALVDTPSDVTIGPFGSNLVAKDYRDSGVPVVFVRDVRPSGFEWNSNTYVSSEKARQLKQHTVEPGDLLATKMGLPPCVACIYPSWMPSGVITADIVRLRPKAGMVNVAWLATMMNHEIVAAQVRVITSGVTRPKITLSDFRHLRVALPSLTEQQAISAIIEAYDARLRAEETYRDKLILQKQGLMIDLLTGQVRLSR
jgi:type I restriction enzyme S subunit